MQDSLNKDLEADIASEFSKSSFRKTETRKKNSKLMRRGTTDGLGLLKLKDRSFSSTQNASFKAIPKSNVNESEDNQSDN